MDKVITTALLIIIGMILAITLFNGAYPAVVESGNALDGMAGRMEDRLQSQIEIIHAAGELDRDGWWQDVNGNGYFDVFIWVKNVGSTRILPRERVDVFFGPEGDFTRIPYISQAGGAYPYWTGGIENGSEWTPTATLKITISYPLPLSSGRYFIKVTLPNGISDEDFLGL